MSPFQDVNNYITKVHPEASYRCLRDANSEANELYRQGKITVGEFVKRINHMHKTAIFCKNANRMEEIDIVYFLIQNGIRVSKSEIVKVFSGSVINVGKAFGGLSGDQIVNVITESALSQIFSSDFARGVPTS
jgi:hypothetical protein